VLKLFSVSFRRRVLTWATRFLRISSGATPAHRRDTIDRGFRSASSSVLQTSPLTESS